MSKKKKILLIVLAVVLVAGGICWRILPDRLTGGTLKLSEDILQNFSLRKISEAIGKQSPQKYRKPHILEYRFLLLI